MVRSLVWLVLVAMALSALSFHLKRVKVDFCPPVENATLEVFARNRIHCAAICELEKSCQGFCYNEISICCRIFSILLAEANETAVDNVGFSMYWSDYVGQTRYGQLLYYYQSYPKHFPGAWNGCEDGGGKLAVPTSQAENELIGSLSSGNDTWIGINLFPDGYWVNIMIYFPINYSNWRDDSIQGQGSTNNITCAIVDNDLFWVATNCFEENSYACQKPID
ncbi:uncharacterized protein [Palaemon carinicauda]|uniref:uncharacterized protein n=1 Tax=Palaemon carinicauda TaxID=392227 RepID=UPI0035B5C88F